MKSNFNIEALYMNNKN